MILLLMVGCNNSKDGDSGNEYPVTVGSVTFKSSPEGVVVLCDSTADIILACSLEAKLVARSDDCTQEGLEILPSVGSKENPDTNKIIESKAQLVFADSTLNKEARQKIENAGITVLSMEVATNKSEMKNLYKTICSVLAGQTTGGKRGNDANR